MRILNRRAASGLITIFTILILLACSSHRKLNNDVTYQYSCDNGGQFTAIVHQDGDQTIIKLGEM